MPIAWRKIMKKDKTVILNLKEGKLNKESKITRYPNITLTTQEEEIPVEGEKQYPIKNSNEMSEMILKIFENYKMVNGNDQDVFFEAVEELINEIGIHFAQILPMKYTKLESGDYLKEGLKRVRVNEKNNIWVINEKIGEDEKNHDSDRLIYKKTTERNIKKFAKQYFKNQKIKETF